MAYTPKSEEELAKEGLLTDGIYDFEVVETSDRPSKKGNDMYTLKLMLWDSNGDTLLLFDYIALGNNFGERKLRHAADACNILAIYETGSMTPADFLHKKGKVEIKIQEGNTDYPLPKNVVKDYIKNTTQASNSIRALPPEVADDGVPF